MTYDIGNPGPDMMQILSYFWPKIIKKKFPCNHCTNQTKL